jgi:DNA polymerase I-like protein with 3'-5' exonuclease and polymerase domains
LEELKEDFEKKSKRLEFEIFEHTGNINLNSSKQLAEALFGRLGIPDYIEDFEREKKNGFLLRMNLELRKAHILLML